MPSQRSMWKPFKMLVWIGAGLYEEEPDEMQELVMSSSALVDGIAVSGASDLHTDDSKADEYDLFHERFFVPSMDALEEMIPLFPNLKCIIVLGGAMCGSLVDTGLLRDMLTRVDR